MDKFKVKVRYTFEGWYEIKAESKQQAEEIARRDCGFVIGGDIHTSNGMHVRNWEFGTHPETRILSARQIEQSAGQGE
ncbi:MAG: hypothetical protein LBU98_03930 [Alistipes sp.]|jgi:hypothetical protein|nr:hypothetical protein [Alistipes sp.]